MLDLLMFLAKKYRKSKNWHKISAIYNKLNKANKTTPMECRKIINKLKFIENYEKSFSLSNLLVSYQNHPGLWNKIASELNLSAEFCESKFKELLRKLSGDP